MPNRPTRNVQKYLDTARKYGPECIIETAEEDDALNDDEFYDLRNRMESWSKVWAWGREDGKGPIKWYKKKAAKPVICEGCGEPIPAEQLSMNGRKRRFHDNNNRCKQLAYRKRRQKQRET